MKKCIEFFCLFCCVVLPNLVYSQMEITPNPTKLLFSETSVDGYKLGVAMSQALQLHGGKTFVVHGYSPRTSIYPNNLNFWTDVIAENYFNMAILNSDLQRLKDIRVENLQNNGKKYLPSVVVNAEENYTDSVFFALGAGINPALQTSKVAWFLWQLDSNLMIHSEKWLIPPLDNSVPMEIGGRKSNGNYVVKSIRQANSTVKYDVVFQEISPEGELVYYKDYGESWDENPIQIGGFKRIDDNNYVAFKNTILDEDFEIKCTFDNNAIFTGASVELLDDGRFLFATANYGQVAPSSNPIYYNTELLLRGDKDCNLDTIFINHVQPSPQKEGTRISGYNVSARDTNHIYFASTTQGWQLNERNNITLRCLTMEGAVLWSYYFGEDASYSTSRVITTDDGGCLLFISKAIEANNISGWTTDVVTVQFDKDGNLVGTSSEQSIEKDEINSAHLYPNPSQNTLHIEHGPQLKNPSLRLFDSYGRLVLENKLQDLQSQIDVAHLASGVYVYQLWSEGAVVQGGKVLKM